MAGPIELKSVADAQQHFKKLQEDAQAESGQWSDRVNLRPLGAAQSIAVTQPDGSAKTYQLWMHNGQLAAFSSDTLNATYTDQILKGIIEPINSHINPITGKELKPVSKGEGWVNEKTSEVKDFDAVMAYVDFDTKTERAKIVSDLSPEQVNPSPTHIGQKWWFQKGTDLTPGRVYGIEDRIGVGKYITTPDGKKYELKPIWGYDDPRAENFLKQAYRVTDAFQADPKPATVAMTKDVFDQLKGDVIKKEIAPVQASAVTPKLPEAAAGSRIEPRHQRVAPPSRSGAQSPEIAAGVAPDILKGLYPPEQVKSADDFKAENKAARDLIRQIHVSYQDKSLSNNQRLSKEQIEDVISRHEKTHPSSGAALRAYHQEVETLAEAKAPSAEFTNAYRKGMGGLQDIYTRELPGFGSPSLERAPVPKIKEPAVTTTPVQPAPITRQAEILPIPAAKWLHTLYPPDKVTTYKEFKAAFTAANEAISAIDQSYQAIDPPLNERLSLEQIEDVIARHEKTYPPIGSALRSFHGEIAKLTEKNADLDTVTKAYNNGKGLLADIHDKHVSTYGYQNFKQLPPEQSASQSQRERPVPPKPYAGSWGPTTTGIAEARLGDLMPPSEIKSQADLTKAFNAADMALQQIAITYKQIRHDSERMSEAQIEKIISAHEKAIPQFGERIRATYNEMKNSDDHKKGPQNIHFKAMRDMQPHYIELSRKYQAVTPPSVSAAPNMGIKPGNEPWMQGQVMFKAQPGNLGATFVMGTSFMGFLEKNPGMVPPQGIEDIFKSYDAAYPELGKIMRETYAAAQAAKTPEERRKAYENGRHEMTNFSLKPSSLNVEPERAAQMAAAAQDPGREPLPDKFERAHDNKAKEPELAAAVADIVTANNSAMKPV
ncbi:MAG: hypothetical protein DYH13_11330 [Alphaproteobacteria bacterium PRO2]|nr:hypothetical protein [Alphaproteobacteria bacterium PRO2]